MSTIHACFNPNQAISDDILSNMLGASAYWKPDATSQAANENKHCQMAKASLFNTARSHNDNVYIDAKSRDMISANVRLDNRSVLAEKLNINAQDLGQLTDSQLTLIAYQHWGRDCPKQLLGDFVFIIWDEAQQQLFCARDHFGIKVLYYAQSQHGFMLSNEHNAFFASGGLKKKVKEEWLVDHLFNQGPSPTASPYFGIEMLPPAHSITIDKLGHTNLTRFWHLEDKTDWQGMSDEALIEELKNRFQHAVKVRLDSEYPLSGELSEGLDSNGIVGFAAEMLGKQPLYTFSYMCEQLNDENRQVWEKTYQDIFEMLDMHDNLKPIWTPPQESESPKQDLENFYHHAGGIMGINGGHFLRSRLAQKQDARVLLSGWGGDHCVSTYGDFYESELFSKGEWLTLHQLIRDKHKRGRGAKPIKSWLQLFIKHFAPSIYRKLVRKLGGLEHALWQRAKDSLLKPEYINRHACHERLAQFTDNYRRYAVKDHHRRELFDVGVEGRLVESELCGRMFRVEYRYPMLDVPLVEFAYNMPSHLKIFQGTERYMFRRVLEGITSKRIQWRIKADVNHPNLDYDKKIIGKLLISQLENSSLAQQYLDISKLKQYMLKYNQGQSLKGLELLLALEKQIQSGDTSIKHKHK